ncbi:hypothetical protein P691DRAFT_518853 [Macrolepiota fuliginosa MF-IS2]|uniref:GPI ethanolamine phosphate transferase 1 n=1 Tax=Macrolepiota fuliginosa MF-IS2 TaxID=1400762 RepID=A0A9P5WZY2_9AGAR|nr:hypothetical protein P691DRAFT_518853 [Macrolepiota fuliginosa MF-IS2]
MREFYAQVRETGYVFTADYGMSVIGNHGDGHPNCTRTSLIAWSKEIRGPLPDTTPPFHDIHSVPWGLSHLYRRDVEQADIATLISALIDASRPVNPVGMLPDVNLDWLRYLAPRLGERTLVEVAEISVRMILEQYRAKHELKRMHMLFHHQYSPLKTGSPLKRVQKQANI